MASQQKAKKSVEKTNDRPTNGIGKKPANVERQTSTGADVEKNLVEASGADDTPMKQCVNVIEKKLRNMVKRKGKLDEYRKLLKSGGTLNADQKEAIAKYEVVEQNMELMKELQKQFLQMNVDYEKQMKKQSRRESIERQRLEGLRLREMLRLNHFLDCLGSEDLRASICDNKDIGLTKENLEQFDEFYKLINISEESESSVDDQLTSMTSHMSSYLDRSEKPVVGVTYRALHDLVQRAAPLVLSLSKGAANGDEEPLGAAVEEPQGVEGEVEEKPLVEQSSSTTSLPPSRVDSNNLHHVINETASESHPFGMKYQPGSDVQGFCFISNDDVLDPAVAQGHPPTHHT